MLNNTKIKEGIDIKKFLEIVSRYPGNKIECTEHTFFRLNQKQRKIFTCKELRKIIKERKTLSYRVAI